MENEKDNVNENAKGADKANLEALQKEVELLMQIIAQLTNKVQSASDVISKSCSSHPPMILGKETKYKTWRQIVNNELKSKNSSYLIDNDETAPPNLVTEQKEIQPEYVVTYLLTRLCDEFRQHIHDVKTSNEIIMKLEDLKYPKLQSIKFVVKYQWLNLKYANRKKIVEEFIKKFEEKMQ